MCILFFFFFQAEDGIRDRTVTGVQTCALPISGKLVAANKVLCYTVATEGGVRSEGKPMTSEEVVRLANDAQVRLVRFLYCRSEERRVGKECRSRWSP